MLARDTPEAVEAWLGSSIIGEAGNIGQANYASSKAGLFGLTMSLAQETARKGITVNSVAPGYISTEMVQAVPKEALDKVIAKIPVGRLGEPDEIARVVEFLADPESGLHHRPDLLRQRRPVHVTRTAMPRAGWCRSRGADGDHRSGAGVQARRDAGGRDADDGGAAAGAGLRGGGRAGGG